MVTSNCAAKINIPKKAIGSPAATHNANRTFKNNAKKNKTNKIPIKPFHTSNSVR